MTAQVIRNVYQTTVQRKNENDKCLEIEIPDIQIPEDGEWKEGDDVKIWVIVEKQSW